MPLLRLAVPADAEALALLAEKTFRATFAEANTPENLELHCRKSYGPAIQSAEILDPACRTLVAEQDGQLLGYLQLRWRAPSIPGDFGRPAEIQRLYVDAPWHGRGLARRLMDEALRMAREGGADRVWLGVWEHNPRAIAFYAKCGFSPAGEHVFQLGEDPQRDLIYIHILSRGV